MTNAPIKDTEMTPANTKRGTTVAWTDRRGRPCTGLVVNVFPGMVVAAPMTCGDLPRETVSGFSLAYLSWPGGVFHNDINIPRRPFERWTISYVRREYRAGRMTKADLERFVAVFGDGCTVAELTEPWADGKDLP